MEHRRNAGLVALLLIGIHLTRAEGYSILNSFDQIKPKGIFQIGEDKTEECTPGDFHPPPDELAKEYFPEGSSVNFRFCSDDGKSCFISQGDKKICYRDNGNKTE